MNILEPLIPDLHVHKKIAATLFNETWTLLDKPDRSAEEDAIMIHMAHASRFHWELVGTPRNRSVGEWQVSRVHAVLRQPDEALYHARRSLEIAEQNGLAPFLVGYSHKAIARAHAITRHPDAREHANVARRLAAEVTDLADKKLLEDDLTAILVALEFKG